MAHFRATIKGTRGLASRLGSPKSGLVVTANGWDTGVRVEAEVIDGKDVLTIFKTGGSNGSHAFRIATVRGDQVEVARC